MRPQPGVSVSRDRLIGSIHALAEFRDPEQAGWTRTVFSPEYQRSRAWVHQQMLDAGLDVTTDAIGNILGRRPGRLSGTGTIVLGSHTDTVRNGGRFDGILGVLAAIEVARRLDEEGTQLDHDLLVCDFFGEESNRFGLSCLGSRAIVGHLTESLLESTADGGSLRDALTASGAEVSAIPRATWDPRTIRAYLELHIEQGPVLEREGIDIGVVTTIAGVKRGHVTLSGRSDHAGGQPMQDRRDALAAGAEAVLIIEQIGRSSDDLVATVGDLWVENAAPNVVPGQVSAVSELRSPSLEDLERACRSVDARIDEVGRSRGVEVRTMWIDDGGAVPMSRQVQQVVAAAAEDLGYSSMPIVSGASHDAAHLAAITPTGMVFVPSVSGRSHCPEEWTEPDDIERGATVLYAALLRMDALGQEIGES